MPVAVASNTESPPGDPVCKAWQVPVQGDVGNMVPPIDAYQSPLIIFLAGAPML